MKSLMPFSIAAATRCVAITATVWAEDLSPGQVDFGAFSPRRQHFCFLLSQFLLFPSTSIRG